jgi:large subunit ribosomal protein L29
MKIKELREKNKNELQNLLREGKDQLRGMRFELVNKQLKKTKEINKTKKTIARIMTILNNKI